MSQPKITPASLAHFLRPDRTVSFWDQLAAQPRALSVKRLSPGPVRSLLDLRISSCSTRQAVRQLDTGAPLGDGALLRGPHKRGGGHA